AARRAQLPLRKSPYQRQVARYVARGAVDRFKVGARGALLWHAGWDRTRRTIGGPPLDEASAPPVCLAGPDESPDLSLDCRFLPIRTACSKADAAAHHHRRRDPQRLHGPRNGAAVAAASFGSLRRATGDHSPVAQATSPRVNQEDKS